MVGPVAKDTLGMFKVNITECIAYALTSPVRHCRLTDVRLPSYFLLNFGVTKHPITGAQWQLPRIVADPLAWLTNDETVAETSLEHEDTDKAFKIHSAVDVSSQYTRAPENVSVNTKSIEINNLDELPPKEPSEMLQSGSIIVKDTVPQEIKTKVPSPVPDTRKASSSYFLCSQSALNVLSGFKPKSRMAAIPLAWKSDSWIQADKLVWRKDMDEFVLELLRKRTLALLKILASSRAAYIVPCSGYKSVRLHNQVAAVLWLGANTPAKNPRCRNLVADLETPIFQQEVVYDPLSPGTSALLQETIPAGCNFTLQADVAASDDTEPPPYAMFKYRSHFIPIYNLPTLLGPEHLARLRATRPCSKGTMAVIKKKEYTIRAQMELWKLIGYMA